MRNCISSSISSVMDVDEISVITGLDRDRVLAAVHALSAEQRAVAVSEFFDGAGPLALDRLDHLVDGAVGARLP